MDQVTSSTFICEEMALSSEGALSSSNVSEPSYFDDLNRLNSVLEAAQKVCDDIQDQHQKEECVHQSDQADSESNVDASKLSSQTSFKSVTEGFSSAASETECEPSRKNKEVGLDPKILNVCDDELSRHSDFTETNEKESTQSVSERNKGTTNFTQCSVNFSESSCTEDKEKALENNSDVLFENCSRIEDSNLNDNFTSSSVAFQKPLSSSVNQKDCYTIESSSHTVQNDKNFKGNEEDVPEAHDPKILSSQRNHVSPEGEIESYNNLKKLDKSRGLDAEDSEKEISDIHEDGNSNVDVQIRNESSSHVMQNDKNFKDNEDVLKAHDPKILSSQRKLVSLEHEIESYNDLKKSDKSHCPDAGDSEKDISDTHDDGNSDVAGQVRNDDVLETDGEPSHTTTDSRISIRKLNVQSDFDESVPLSKLFSRIKKKKKQLNACKRKKSLTSSSSKRKRVDTSGKTAADRESASIKDTDSQPCSEQGTEDLSERSQELLKLVKPFVIELKKIPSCISKSGSISCREFEKLSGKVIKESRSSRRKAKYDASSSPDQFALPFEFGFHREVVFRKSSLRKKADVYYLPPTGGKLRSIREVATYLSLHEDLPLTENNFTFMEEEVSYSEFETVRYAEPSARKSKIMTKAAKKSKRSFRGNQFVKVVERDLFAPPKVKTTAKKPSTQSPKLAELSENHNATTPKHDRKVREHQRECNFLLNNNTITFSKRVSQPVQRYTPMMEEKRKRRQNTLLKKLWNTYSEVKKTNVYSEETSQTEDNKDSEEESLLTKLWEDFSKRQSSVDLESLPESEKQSSASSKGQVKDYSRKPNIVVPESSSSNPPEAKNQSSTSDVVKPRAKSLKNKEASSTLNEDFSNYLNRVLPPEGSKQASSGPKGNSNRRNVTASKDRTCSPKKKRAKPKQTVVKDASKAASKVPLELKSKTVKESDIHYAVRPTAGVILEGTPLKMFVCSVNKNASTFKLRCLKKSSHRMTGPFMVNSQNSSSTVPAYFCETCYEFTVFTRKDYKKISDDSVTKKTSEAASSESKGGSLLRGSALPQSQTLVSASSLEASDSNANTFTEKGGHSKDKDKSKSDVNVSEKTSSSLLSLALTGASSVSSSSEQKSIMPCEASQNHPNSSSSLKDTAKKSPVTVMKVDLMFTNGQSLLKNSAMINSSNDKVTPVSGTSSKNSPSQESPTTLPVIGNAPANSTPDLGSTGIKIINSYSLNETCPLDSANKVDADLKVSTSVSLVESGTVNSVGVTNAPCNQPQMILIPSTMLQTQNSISSPNQGFSLVPTSFPTAVSTNSQTLPVVSNTIQTSSLTQNLSLVQNTLVSSSQSSPFVQGTFTTKDGSQLILLPQNNVGTLINPVYTGIQGVGNTPVAIPTLLPALGNAVPLQNYITLIPQASPPIAGTTMTLTSAAASSTSVVNTSTVAGTTTVVSASQGVLNSSQLNQQQKGFINIANCTEPLPQGGRIVKISELLDRMESQRDLDSDKSKRVQAHERTLRLSVMNRVPTTEERVQTPEKTPRVIIMKRDPTTEVRVQASEKTSRESIMKRDPTTEVRVQAPEKTSMASITKRDPTAEERVQAPEKTPRVIIMKRDQTTEVSPSSGDTVSRLELKRRMFASVNYVEPIPKPAQLTQSVQVAFKLIPPCSIKCPDQQFIPTLFCQSCENFYHPECVKFSNSDADAAIAYTCPNCKHKSRNQSSLLQRKTDVDIDKVQKIITTCSAKPTLRKDVDVPHIDSLKNVLQQKLEGESPSKSNEELALINTSKRVITRLPFRDQNAKTYTRAVTLAEYQTTTTPTTITVARAEAVSSSLSYNEGSKTTTPSQQADIPKDCSLNCPGRSNRVPTLLCQKCSSFYHPECVNFTECHDDALAYVCKACVKKEAESRKRKPDAACSEDCPGQNNLIPTLPCQSCYSFFHPECVNFSDGDVFNFVCQNCTSSQPDKKRKISDKETSNVDDDDVQIIDTEKEAQGSEEDLIILDSPVKQPPLSSKNTLLALSQTPTSQNASETSGLVITSVESMNEENTACMPSTADFSDSTNTQCSRDSADIQCISDSAEVQVPSDSPELQCMSDDPAAESLLDTVPIVPVISSVRTISEEDSLPSELVDNAVSDLTNFQDSDNLPVSSAQTGVENNTEEEEQPLQLQYICSASEDGQMVLMPSLPLPKDQMFQWEEVENVGWLIKS